MASGRGIGDRYGDGVPAPVPPSPWDFGDPSRYDELDDLVAIGADLAPGTLVAAYGRGLFPMPSGRPGGPPYWFCPVERGILPLDGLRVSRSLRRSRARFELRVNTAFAAVVDACADPRREGAWIDRDIRAAYLALHELGWAHSVETWRDGRLVGGLYGVAVGGLFAGESMFHHETDASKAALVHLIGLLDDHPDTLVDCQWLTAHLASLGAVAIHRDEYMARLERAVHRPLPARLFGLDVPDGAPAAP